MKAANDNRPLPERIRFSVKPRLVPPQKAARRLHLTLAEFERCSDSLLAHGFPAPCPVVGHYDLKAIDAWLDRVSGLRLDMEAEPVKTSDFEKRLEALG